MKYTSTSVRIPISWQDTWSWIWLQKLFWWLPAQWHQQYKLYIPHFSLIGQHRSQTIAKVEMILATCSNLQDAVFCILTNHDKLQCDWLYINHTISCVKRDKDSPKNYTTCLRTLSKCIVQIASDLFQRLQFLVTERSLENPTKPDSKKGCSEAPGSCAWHLLGTYRSASPVPDARLEDWSHCWCAVYLMEV